MKYVQINETKSTDIGLRIVGYSRPSFAENRDIYSNVDGREGSNHHSQPDGMYNFSVTFRTKFSNEEERIERLEAITDFLYTEEFVKIVQSDMPDRYRLGKVADFSDYTPEYNVMEVDVEFITKPYSFANNETVIVEEYTLANNTFTQVIEDLGSAFSEFELTIEFRDVVNGLKIHVEDSELFIDRTIAISDVVRVNTDSFSIDKIKLTGDQVTSIESLILDVYGEFPTLSKRKKTLVISSASSFRCKTTLRYTKRFLL